ncbi:GNAT family N-acetyltransferase [Micromonospora humi]|uniref:Protein N-acetyltransferase, RimJ/RimL family n=1 Tax=Micromonospora humi TaxID=745366 RepID=A0A1C5ID53_9ACTN|nr:GNAT family N-acetyltransferase [Micromonospora humi]SCG56280.1 Protein N-acetyltransferase, RimJ/RimL family [Micromonospora humi]
MDDSATAPATGAQHTVSGRLLLRAPTAADLADVFRIHGDPRTNQFNPAGPHTGVDASGELLDEWLDHWRRHGFGYWAVQSASSGEVLGFAGVRHGQWIGRPMLNLYYRFAPPHWGWGYATEAARHAVEWAATHVPGPPVLARTTADNLPSIRTAQAAGLVRRPDLDATHDGVRTVVLASR